MKKLTVMNNVKAMMKKNHENGRFSFPDLAVMRFLGLERERKKKNVLVNIFMSLEREISNNDLC